MTFDANTIASLGWALGWHETGNDPAVIYRLSFAGEGASGASFGRYQADCHADPQALPYVAHILAASGMEPAEQQRILAALHGHLVGNPLSAADTAAIDAALSSIGGRILVDQLDRTTLQGALGQLQRCVSAAASNGSTLSFDVLVVCLIWINQAGAPTTILRYLAGQQVELGGKPVPRLPSVANIGLSLIMAYMDMLPFEERYPKERARLLQAAIVGQQKLAELSSAASKTGRPAAGTFGEDH